jgi:hypothetical protein
VEQVVPVEEVERGVSHRAQPRLATERCRRAS